MSKPTAAQALELLLDYATQRSLIERADRVWARNQLLAALSVDSPAALSGAGDEVEVGAQATPPANAEGADHGRGAAGAPADSVGTVSDEDLPGILDALVDDCVARGVCQDSIVYRDLADTALMGALTPAPREVRRQFNELRAKDPQAATDWMYQFSQDTNYIRRDRGKKDLRWVTPTEYGALDITINLAKPEKDPKAIAAARDLPAGDYPQCLLCVENEGYAGRVNHPARQNHRVAPVTINDSPWFIQYSPYVYYPQHCIVFNQEHTPMRIDRAAFEKLLDFVDQFPHFFVGSNADLPIVGGSILAHDHFQGGQFEFAMERAPIAEKFVFAKHPSVEAGIVDWPMSVLRLRGADRDELAQMADEILTAWRAYTDPDAFVFAETEGQPHNTITPIARRRGSDFELDLVLRNNITTPQHPMGVFHPHAELHHLKKENIGLIEVMGLAVLPARLKEELEAVTRGLVAGADLSKDPVTEKHAQWAQGANGFADEVAQVVAEADSAEQAEAAAWAIVQQKVGEAFATVLEHAGVFKRDDSGEKAFERFLSTVGAERE